MNTQLVVALPSARSASGSEAKAGAAVDEDEQALLATSESGTANVSMTTLRFSSIELVVSD